MRKLGAAKIVNQYLTSARILLSVMALMLTGMFSTAAVIAGGEVMPGSRQRIYQNAGAPLSGSTNGTFAGECEPGAKLMDTTNNVEYINEGTKLSPYWTPTSYDQPGLIGYYHDFRDGVGKAVANGDNTALLAGSGIRIFGQGIEEADSGLTVRQEAEAGPIGELIATNQDLHGAAIGIGTTVMPYEPAVNGPLVIDVNISHDSDLLVRALFVGFAGVLADLQNPIVSGDTVTLTQNQPDLAGLLMDADLTDAAGLFAARNKSNGDATLLVSATGVNTGVDAAAAGTFQRLRVEISAAGVMTCFADKVEIASIAASLDTNEEVSPVLYLESTDGNTKQLDVKHFSCWATKV